MYRFFLWFLALVLLFFFYSKIDQDRHDPVRQESHHICCLLSLYVPTPLALPISTSLQYSIRVLQGSLRFDYFLRIIPSTELNLEFLNRQRIHIIEDAKITDSFCLWKKGICPNLNILFRNVAFEPLLIG